MSDQLLETIVGSLQARAEVTAVWLAGSRGRGTNDAYSDIDIWVAIDDAAMAEVVTDPLAYIHQIVPTIMQVVAPEIAPAGGAFVGSWVPVGSGFCQVDWYLAPTDGCTRAQDTLLVYGDVPVAVEAPAEMLASDDVTRKVNDNLVLALLMVSNLIKHGKRNQSWQATTSIRHADQCLVKARWVLVERTEPGFTALTRTVLTEPARVDRIGIEQTAAHLLDQIEQTTQSAGLGESLVPAITALRATLEQWLADGDDGFVTDTGLHIRSVAEFYATLPRRRVGAGLLITNANDEILLLETTYKPNWEIPGGHVDEGESPRVCAAREVMEEIGVPITPGDLLVIDHVAQPLPKGDMLAFVYDGGVIDDPATIMIDHVEIRAAHFVPLDQVAARVTPDMARRLDVAMRARRERRPIEIGTDMDGQL